MKKTLSLLILLFSLLSFAQEKEYRQAAKLFNDKKYEESLVIADKLLNKEFGELSGAQEFYSLQIKLRCYNFIRDYKKSYEAALTYLTFVKNSNGLFSDEEKEKTIDDAKNFIAKVKLKIPSEQTIASNATTDNSDKQIAETKSASDNKTVTLTVSGTGKTLEEAKLNALRSAIEQAFGAFVSSKTEILNDKLVKDEIVSVSNGNIQKYDVVSQLEIPNNGYAMTLNATVSIEKLTTFAESKGVTVEFKGSMFGLKIKLQKLNEKNELNACINILSVVHELLQIGYDYVLETGEPRLFKDTKYSIKFKVTGKPNSNFYKAMDYLKSSLTNLQMSENEILEYEKTNKKNYEFRGFHLRNELSYKTLKNIDNYTNYYAGNFNLIINNEKKISGPDLGGIFGKKSLENYKPYTYPSFMFHQDYSYRYEENSYTSYLFKGMFGSELEDEYKGNTTLWNPQSFTENPVEFQWNQLFDLAEIEKFNSITITGKGVNSRIKNGGFVIYEDEARLIIASPYCLNLEESLGLPIISTSKKIFEGKSNMNLLKDNQDINALYDLVLKYNIENNTDWHIPSEEELKLYVKEVYSTHSKTYKKNSIFCSNTIIERNISCFDSVDTHIDFSFKNGQKYGIPFNSYDSFELLERLFSGHSYIEKSSAIPLVKYVNK